MPNADGRDAAWQALSLADVGTRWSFPTRPFTLAAMTRPLPPQRSAASPTGPDAGAPSRRQFLKTASVLTVGSASALGIAGCDTDGTNDVARGTTRVSLDRSLLDALAAVVLPESLGSDGVRLAVDRFNAWVAGYQPVAEEMHGYGYADIRYLPADPAPAWQAQLAALELLAQRMTRSGFIALPPVQRRAVVEAAIRQYGGERLPSPLAASHVAVALLAHWSSTPDAWNLALGAAVSPTSCRALNDATRKPLPIATTTGGATV